MALVGVTQFWYALEMSSNIVKMSLRVSLHVVKVRRRRKRRESSSNGPKTQTLEG